MNNNVIISWYSQNRNVYHTDICRQVHKIADKKYITEAEADKMQLRECCYCKDEYQHKNPNPSTLAGKLDKMDPEEVDL